MLRDKKRKLKYVQRKDHHAREEAWFGKNHRERSRMETIITEMSRLTSRLSSRLDGDEDGAGKLERKAEEVTQNVAKKKKKKTKRQT